MMNRSHFAVVAVLLAFAATSGAQTVTIALSGTVIDPSGAPVPGADLQLVSQTTHSTLTAKTNSVGLFRFPLVQPGRYELTIQASGFKNYVESDIDLTSSETRDLGRLSMQLGTLSDKVTVEAVATP